MERIKGLYPQYQPSEDRRKQNIPVAVERRSGKDRRGEDRVPLDKQLTKDIYMVKSRVAQLENLAPGLFVSRVTSQSPTFAAKNNMTQDRLQKEAAQTSFVDIKAEEERLKEKESTAFKAGILAVGLATAITLSFMGSTAAVIALGTGVYIGARVLKAMVVKELQESSDKKNNKRY